jgi:hypothetical protein
VQDDEKKLLNKAAHRMNSPKIAHLLQPLAIKQFLILFQNSTFHE